MNVVACPEGNDNALFNSFVVGSPFEFYFLERALQLFANEKISCNRDLVGLQPIDTIPGATGFRHALSATACCFAGFDELPDEVVQHLQAFADTQDSAFEDSTAEVVGVTANVSISLDSARHASLL